MSEDAIEHVLRHCVLPVTEDQMRRIRLFNAAIDALNVAVDETATFPPEVHTVWSFLKEQIGTIVRSALSEIEAGQVVQPDPETR